MSVADRANVGMLLRGRRLSFVFTGRRRTVIADALRARPVRVSRVEIRGAHVLITVAGRTRTWHRGDAAFLFPPHGGSGWAGVLTPCSMLVATDHDAVLFDCSAFTSETFGLLRRHLQQFVAIGEAARPNPVFSGRAAA
jgi:hypothetical protein